MATLPLRGSAEGVFSRAVGFPRISRLLSYRVSRFVSFMLILLLIGVGSWILNARLFSPKVTGWLHLHPDTTSWKGLFLGFGIWVGAGALCLVVLKALLNAGDFLKAVAAMWRPVVVIAAAAYLLFFNDQGRELGLSLLGERYVLPIIFVFVSLFYWAANTWHTARLGIDRGLKNGVLLAPPSGGAQIPQTSANSRVLRGDERWLYWPPRLLGVCAHLLAAINLSLAAWSFPLQADSNVLRALAWTAPLAIVFATAFVWAEDTRRSSRGKKFASASKVMWARRVSRAAIVGELLLLGSWAATIGEALRVGGPAVAAVTLRHLEGFLFGTVSISLSAVAFLMFISWLRNRTPPLGADASAQERAEDDARQQRQIKIFTIGLFALAFLVAVLAWTFPTWFGALGSMVVAYFAFGAILALANAIELAIEFASGRAIIKQWLGEWATPRALSGCAMAFAIVFGVVNAWLHPFHRVRLCDGGDCVAVVSPNERPTVAEAAGAWYEQAKAAYKGEGPVPMLIVATAGGGIRAAYWTATVLEHLEEDFEIEGGSVRPYLFAISGVSGGSVGATAFEAALTQRDENRCTPDKPGDTAGKSGDKACPLATDFLKEDFLAPALASLVFQDAPSSFLPDFGQGDRGTALERSFEHASNNLLARPFLDLISFTEGAIANGGPAPPWRPILLLNATHEETGNRIITGHVRIERNVFVDSLDALNVLQNDVRASTAAHNSARFTYVSPAGDLQRRNGALIDGGYFENFGALTALELAHAAARAVNGELPDEPPKVKLVILMISSDPDLDKNHMLVRINGSTKHPGQCRVSVAERQISRPSPNYFSVDPTGVENALVNEFIAPFEGLEKVREAHGNWAAAELAAEVCTEINDEIRETRPYLVGNPPDLSEEVSLDETQPFDVSSLDSPYFAHLAMCTEKPGQPPTLKAPLGWVLSKATQDHFKELLGECGNYQQLQELETALGGPEQFADR